MSAREEQVKKYENKTYSYLNKNSKYADVLISFYNWLNKENSTKYNYIRFCNTFLMSRNKEIDALSVDDYTSFLALYKNKNSVYQVNIYTALMHFSKYLFKSGKNCADPMSDIQSPKRIEKQETIKKRDNNYLKKEELVLFLHNVRHGVGTEREISWQKKYAERDQFLIYLFLSTGARCSAVTQMDVDDIDEEDDVTFIRVTEKGGKVRKYFLTDELYVMLHSYLDLRKEILSGKADTKALFVTKDGRRISNREIHSIVHKYGKGIKDLSPHKLRATFGTMLYENTKDIYMVQKAMGHANPQTTQIYIRGQQEKIQKESSELISKKLFEI